MCSRTSYGTPPGWCCSASRIGLAGALALTRVMKSLLFEVSALDPFAFALAALSMMLVACSPRWFPRAGPHASIRWPPFAARPDRNWGAEELGELGSSGARPAAP